MTKLKDMTFMELVVECVDKGIPYEGCDADALRKKLAPKKVKD